MEEQKSFWSRNAGAIINIVSVVLLIMCIYFPGMRYYVYIPILLMGCVRLFGLLYAKPKFDWVLFIHLTQCIVSMAGVILGLLDAKFAILTCIVLVAQAAIGYALQRFFKAGDEESETATK